MVPVYPLPKHADGRRAQISDGFHSLDDVRAGRAKRQHRGADLMYRKLLPSKPQHPHSSKWYEIPKPSKLGGYDVPALAPQTGMVVAAGQLATGWWVAMDLSGGVGFAVHHLSAVLVKPGAYVGPGTPLGFVGGSPVGYGLVHAHCDLAVSCRFSDVHLDRLGKLDGSFVDPAKYLSTCRHITLQEAWGDAGRVG